MSSKRAFLLILFLYLALAVAYSVVGPLGEAPDEADHYSYITYLGEYQTLPVGPKVTQSKHPPLYHATAAALAGWTGLDFSFLRSNPDAVPLGPDKPPNLFVHTTLEASPWRGGALAMHLARFLSIAFGAVTVWGAWRLGSIVFPQRPAIGLLAAGFLAGLPGFLFISGSVNNDNAAGAFGSLVLVLCALTLSRGLSWQRSALLGLALGLGLLSKVGTLALWPLVALVAGGAWLQSTPEGGARSGWVAGGEWRVAGSGGPEGASEPATLGRESDESAVQRGREASRWRTLPALLGHLALAWGLGLLIASPWLLRNVRLYGDPFGWELVRATVDQRLAPMTLGDVGWLLRGFHRTFWGRFGGAGQIELPAWAQVAAVVFTLVVVVGAVRFVVSSVRYQVSGARSAAHGLEAGDHRSSLLFVYVVQLMLLAAAPVLSFLSVVSYSGIALGTDQARLMFPALAAMAVWVGVGVVGLADWGRKVRKGERLTVGGEQSRVDGGQVAKAETSTRDTMHGDGSLVAGFTAVMAVFGLVVLFGLIRPGFAPPKPMAPAGSQPNEILARFGDRLALVGVELPAGPLPAGQPAAVRLLWWSGQTLDDDLRPTLRLIHQDGWLAAEWSHAPAGGRYATDRWQSGEVIADDYLILPQPPSPGVYHVELGVRPFGGDWLPVQAPSAEPPFVRLGQVVYE